METKRLENKEKNRRGRRRGKDRDKETKIEKGRGRESQI